MYCHDTGMSSVVTIKPITRRNALVFRAVRLRALQDAPTAFGSTYARTVRLTGGGAPTSPDLFEREMVRAV